MEPEHVDHLEQIKEYASRRRELLRELDILQGFLAEDIRDAIAAGILTELGAHQITGISRTTIRDWLGKGKT